MARTLNWPAGLAIVARQPLSGPRSVGGAVSESIIAFVQTTASPFGLWRWSFTVRPMRKMLARRHRGTVLALHGGANALRVPFCDPDGLNFADAGVDATPAEIRAGVPWDNGKSWDNGQNWGIAKPWAAIAAAAAKGDTIVDLVDEHWGHTLGVGDAIGFVPLHFGLYWITEILGVPGQPTLTGRYRIWPPLRKALATTDWATLDPVMAMRLESEAAATASRGRSLAEGNTLTLVEVEDSVVRSDFDD